MNTINIVFLSLFISFIFPMVLSRKKNLEISTVIILYLIAQIYIALHSSPERAIHMAFVDFVLGLVGGTFFYFYAKKKGVFDKKQ